MPTQEIQPIAVPVEEVPMHEVHNQEEFQEALKRILGDTLPGFVIRAAGFEGSDMAGHEARAQMVVDALNQVDSQVGHTKGKYSSQPTVEGVSSRGVSRPEKGIGFLHDDAFISNPKETINVHTTIEGGGKVVLVNSGTERGKRSIFTASRGHQEHLKMNEHLEQGVVDPEQMSNLLHTTEVSQGDTIVFPIVNQAGPVLHRFDTGTEWREANATLVNPTPQIPKN